MKNNALFIEKREQAYLLEQTLRNALPVDRWAEVAHQSRQIAAIVQRQARSCGWFYTLREYVKIAALLNFSSHFAVSRALAQPRVRQIANYHPRAAFKYLRKYLAHGLCLTARAEILASHYGWLNHYVASDFMARICEGQIPLWEETRGETQYRIALTYPRIGHREGELALVFQEGATTLFTVSFTLAPGQLFDLPSERVAFVGRLQGSNGGFEAIKRATKACEDISPLALLLAATQALVASFGAQALVGVGATGQISVGGKHATNETAMGYDDFWRSVGAEELAGGLFHLSATQEEKPLSLIKANHRSRVKRKRQFKTALAEAIALAFRQRCLR